MLGDAEVVALALWGAHTHALDAADYTPYINVGSAERESGKSNLLAILRPIVRNGWKTGGCSSAALMRKVDADAPTVFVDEADATFGQAAEFTEKLRGILNTGFERTGSYSVCVGEGANMVVRDFRTFAPKAIAGIGNRLPETVRSRSIRIWLKRRRPDEPVAPFRLRVIEQQGNGLNAQFEAALSEPVISRLRQSSPDIPDDLGDRNADIWEPLLALADLAGGEWPEKARRAALELARELVESIHSPRKSEAKAETPQPEPEREPERDHANAEVVALDLLERKRQQSIDNIFGGEAA